MQGLESSLRKKPELIKDNVRRQENKEEINSYSDMIGDAIAYAPISETNSKIYKLDYLDDVEELRMKM